MACVKSSMYGIDISADERIGTKRTREITKNILDHRFSIPYMTRRSPENKIYVTPVPAQYQTRLISTNRFYIPFDAPDGRRESIRLYLLNDVTKIEYEDHHTEIVRSLQDCLRNPIYLDMDEDGDISVDETP